MKTPRDGCLLCDDALFINTSYGYVSVHVWNIQSVRVECRRAGKEGGGGAMRVTWLWRPPNEDELFTRVTLIKRNVPSGLGPTSRRWILNKHDTCISVISETYFSTVLSLRPRGMCNAIVSRATLYVSGSSNSGHWRKYSLTHHATCTLTHTHPWQT